MPTPLAGRVGPASAAEVEALLRIDNREVLRAELRIQRLDVSGRLCGSVGLLLFQTRCLLNLLQFLLFPGNGCFILLVLYFILLVQSGKWAAIYEK